MHDTLQLEKAAKADPIISTIFQGVFAADQVPWTTLQRLPQWSIIINTDPIDKPGQHWVAALKRHNKCFFFDSYGKRPTTYQPRLWRMLNQCKANDKDYQQTYSTVCGDYCLLFLRLFTTKDFDTNDFSYLEKIGFDEDDDEGNDKLVHKTVHQWFPRILNVEKHNQCSRLNKIQFSKRW